MKSDPGIEIWKPGPVAVPEFTRPFVAISRSSQVMADGGQLLPMQSNFPPKLTMYPGGVQGSVSSSPQVMDWLGAPWVGRQFISVKSPQAQPVQSSRINLATQIQESAAPGHSVDSVRKYVPGAVVWLAKKVSETELLGKVPLAIGPNGPVKFQATNVGAHGFPVLAEMQPKFPAMVTSSTGQAKTGVGAPCVHARK